MNSHFWFALSRSLVDADIGRSLSTGESVVTAMT
jgi:hypothetical protein